MVTTRSSPNGHLNHNSPSTNGHTSASTHKTTTNKRPLKPLQSRSAKTQYLILYNAVCALGWAIILARLILINYFLGYEYVHEGLGQFLKWHQTLAALEIVHAVTGFVRSPWFTTSLQVLSRYGLVWNVAWFFPSIPSQSPIYSTMILAWSTTEIIRYSYFTLSLAGYHLDFLTWLRYSAFIVLYPIGISSEAWLIYKATGPSWYLHPLFGVAQWLLLGVYVPGTYVLYGHMLSQRRKFLKQRREQRAAEKAAAAGKKQ